MSLSEDARKARKQYMKKYRQKNKERINQKQRQRYQDNPTKYKQYQQKYWERKSIAEDVEE